MTISDQFCHFPSLFSQQLSCILPSHLTLLHFFPSTQKPFKASYLNVLFFQQPKVKQNYSYMTDKSQPHQVPNILSLVRLKPDCKIIPTRVDFSTPSKSPSTQASITPSFTNDRCFYTPAFSLPVDSKHYHDQLRIEKSRFEEKMQRSCQENSAFCLSQPSVDLMAVGPNSNYCQICQVTFEDYNEHCLLKTHETRMTKGQASEMIRELCLEFSSTLEGKRTKAKTKNIKKQIKKEQKKVKGGRVNNMISQTISSLEGMTMQNHSTGIIEDLLV